ncbi:ADP-forming succinate--CoA ligase subunit beta [Schwartzia succinivorans]|jgi:succinyl-CoA synthetase beta subunit|uniref:Succinate--CoA ligase [ADP-forming] subunit beta n=1 Tax=Schwartzia succinivorans DSM 10502 TaxID=1123243 RepID=A0A1M4ZUH8_9FIRM|nr:ADP-forming succinate--CoA ligase subunit beta [Schwartzia succinivorans]SHF21703.1 succinyl-CoA synthetase beta subunit [Schwartzia succinivorans DSM 10502]
MNIHEYQSKQILREFGVKVPNGNAAFSPEEAARVAKDLGTPVVVVKAQIHAGGRGKAGGVKIAHNIDEVKQFASGLLGKVLVTHQTGPEGKQVNRLLIEEGSNIEKEYYLGFVIDRKTAQIVMMGSEEGGMEIEKVAEETPEKIFKEYIDPVTGLMPFQTRRMAFRMNFKPEVMNKVTKFMDCLYKAFVAKDCSLAEINPLVVTKENDVIALDAKLNFDDSALFRHPEIEALRDESEEDPKERAAAKAALSYVNLGGDVACMVNGAGLAMATVDIIKYYGGEPANFLDVGGDSTVEKIAEAFRIMQSDDQVHSVFVNIFGGINKCDVIASGIVEAAKVVGLRVPVIARLDGTNVEAGRKILKEANVPGVYMAADMDDGAKRAVELAAAKKSELRIKA